MDNWVEGLPPVGVVCECKVTSTSDWVKCEIVAHHNQYAIAYVDDNTVMLSCGIRFRHIRTPEQIAEDERDKAAHELFRSAWPETHSWGDLSPHWQEAFYRLADSGYRKEQK